MCLILLFVKDVNAIDVSHSIVFVTTISNQSIFPSHEIKLDNTSVNVEIADTPDRMEQGLQYRDPLSYNNGMLFVPQSPQVLPMWMPNMKFPLDIIWFDINGKVQHIEKNVPPCTAFDNSSCPIYNKDGQPSKYALEVSAGFVDKYNISMNSKLVTSIPEFDYLAGMIITVAIVGVLTIPRKFRFQV